jgi:hypothetical protein
MVTGGEKNPTWIFIYISFKLILCNISYVDALAMVEPTITILVSLC